MSVFIVAPYLLLINTEFIGCCRFLCNAARSAAFTLNPVHDLSANKWKRSCFALLQVVVRYPETFWYLHTGLLAWSSTTARSIALYARKVFASKRVEVRIL